MTPSTRRSWRVSASGSAADPLVPRLLVPRLLVPGPPPSRRDRFTSAPRSVVLRVEIGSRGGRPLCRVRPASPPVPWGTRGLRFDASQAALVARARRAGNEPSGPCCPWRGRTLGPVVEVVGVGCRQCVRRPGRRRGLHMGEERLARVNASLPRDSAVFEFPSGWAAALPCAQTPLCAHGSAASGLDDPLRSAEFQRNTVFAPRRPSSPMCNPARAAFLSAPTTSSRPPTGRTTTRQNRPRPCCGSRLSQWPVPALRAAACGDPVPDGEQDTACGETAMVPETAEAAFHSARGRGGREHLKASGLPSRDPLAPAVPDPVVGVRGGGAAVLPAGARSRCPVDQGPQRALTSPAPAGTPRQQPRQPHLHEVMAGRDVYSRHQRPPPLSQDEPTIRANPQDPVRAPRRPPPALP